MSAAISIGYENNPALTSMNLLDLSLNECARESLLNGKKQLKYHANSVTCGTSDCL